MLSFAFRRGWSVRGGASSGWRATPRSGCSAMTPAGPSRSCPLVRCSGWSRCTSGKDSGAEAKTVRPRKRGNSHTWWNAKDGCRRKARRRCGVLWHAHSSFL